MHSPDVLSIIQRRHNSWEMLNSIAEVDKDLTFLFTDFGVSILPGVLMVIQTACQCVEEYSVVKWADDLTWDMEVGVL